MPRDITIRVHLDVDLRYTDVGGNRNEILLRMPQNSYCSVYGAHDTGAPPTSALAYASRGSCDYGYEVPRRAKVNGK